MQSFLMSDDRLNQVFRTVKLSDYGARNTIEQMDVDLKNFKRDRDKLEYVDYFNHFLKKKKSATIKIFICR